MSNIKLGDRVRCTITGFTGTAVERVEELNGRVDFSVAPPVGADGKMPERWRLNSANLQVIDGLRGAANFINNGHVSAGKKPRPSRARPSVTAKPAQLRKPATVSSAPAGKEKKARKR